MKNIKTVLIFGMLTLVLAGSAWAEKVPGTVENSTNSTANGKEELADFNTCARIALRQSPVLSKTSLEIEVRRLDEKDSRSDLFPTFVFRTAYYPVKPNADEDPLNYSLQWISESYNPMVAYLTMKVKQLITRAATYIHQKAISEGLQKLAQGFLELDTLTKLAVLQKEAIVLAQKSLAYSQKQLKSGETTPLEVQIAAQELELAQADEERLASEQARVRQTMQAFMGLKPGQDLTFDLKQTPEQVLGSFDANAANWEQTKAHSVDLKVQNLKKELQSWNVSLAKMKLMPGFFVGVQTPDPLNTQNVRGVYFSMGLTWTIPILGGDKRWRDITRQKTILQQAGAEVETTGIELQNRWQAGKEKLRQAATALKKAQSQEELARLKLRQSEILYQAGDEPYNVLLDRQKKYLSAKMNTLQKITDYNLEKLALRHLSGDLLYRYVDERF
ncbi:MAG: TolC family protein [Thermodesulfobacteriota bacterium]